MIKKYPFAVRLVVLFVVLMTLYYFVDFEYLGGGSTEFLTLATFLFAIFLGFFISRQSNRHGSARQNLTVYDGHMSFIYRTFGHIDQKLQEKVGSILDEHYANIVRTHSRDVTFQKKTTLLIDIHAVLEESGKKKGNELVATSRDKILEALHDAQTIRKNMLSIQRERISREQWMFVFILTITLLISLIITIPSYGFIVGSVLKATFTIAVLFTLLLLDRLNRLQLFGEPMGERSARDVVEIVKKS